MNIIKSYRPHIILEVQLQHVLSGVEGKERIARWFDYLRYEMRYSVFYIPWEEIKYEPQGVKYGKFVSNISSFLNCFIIDWNLPLPLFQNITDIEIESLCNVAGYTLNFWFYPN